MCPVCTVGVVAGLGISRLLGIDDTVTSIWIGAFILSFSFITIDWIAKRWPRLRSAYYLLPATILMYLFVLVPLYLNHSIGLVYNRLWGFDKIILGVFIGSMAFLAGVLADKKVRKIRGKQLFNYQKVIFPLLALIIASATTYLVTRY
jgi:hypothetical protein